MPLRRLASFLLLALLAAAPARAEVPYPACQPPACTNPADYASYLFLTPGTLPNDFDPGSGNAWKFKPTTGMNVTGAWQRSTGRPDVFVAVLDSGIEWDRRALAKATALNAGELPLPPGCAVYDCNGDGVVNVADYPNVPDANGNGFRDGQDMIRFYSNGVDDDGNGYVDDIAGWDFYQHDNDPSDDVRYGHGTGEASDQVEEANDGGGFPGVAPSSMFVPLRVGDSFIAVDADFAQAVVYGVDRGAAVISEALGTITASQVSQAAIDYAYRRGVPIIASAADEQSRHHNFPAAFEHTLWVNSIRNGDGTFVEQKNVYTIQNGCTNHGGRAWTAISSTSCSSEATGRSGGISLLLVSHGRNLVDRGLLAPYPGNSPAHPFSAEEVRQLFRASADDIDHSGSPALTMNQLLQILLSAPAQGLLFGSSQYATQPGWDEFTGYGRPDVARMLDLAATAIPPEADLSGSLRWFDTVDPARTPSVPVVGSAAAVRTGGSFHYTVEAGCGVQPTAFTQIGSGFSVAPLSRDEIEDATETRILIESEALRRSMRYGNDDWEAGIVAAFHALSLQVERQAKPSAKVETADLFAMEERHHQFHRALISHCRSPRLLELADRLYVETQRYRLPNYFGGVLGKRRRDAAAEHREIMDATLRRSEDAVRLLAAHYRKTADIIEASIEWPSPRGGN